MAVTDIVGNDAALRQLCERFGVRALYLFGSGNSASFDPAFSDLDFLVEFPPLPPQKHADAYFGLHAALRQLFNREVDLVELDGVPNPFVRSAIEGTKVPLYVAP